MPKTATEQVRPGDLEGGDRLFWGGELQSEVVSAIDIDTSIAVVLHKWPGQESPTRLQLPADLLVNRIIERASK